MPPSAEISPSVPISSSLPTPCASKAISAHPSTDHTYTVTPQSCQLLSASPSEAYETCCRTIIGPHATAFSYSYLKFLLLFSYKGLIQTRHIRFSICLQLQITIVGEYWIITSYKCLHSLKGAPLPLTEENITVTD